MDDNIYDPRWLLGQLLEEQNGFEANVLQGLKVESQIGDQVVCSFPVTKPQLNSGGTLHGGVLATLVDLVTTLSGYAAAGALGVSVNLSVNYASPARDGDIVLIAAKADKVGTFIAHLSAEMRDKATNKLLGTGTHAKFVY